MRKLINVKNNQFQNVLKKAIEVRPLVRPLRVMDGVYDVRASGGDFYQVSFWREDGQMFGQCECKAAEKDFYCYHFAAALLAHSAFVREGLRRPALSVVGGRLASVSA